MHADIHAQAARALKAAEHNWDAIRCPPWGGRSEARLLQVADEAWFGGGCDLTPNFLTHEHPDAAAVTDLTPDITAFHTFWRRLCDQHSPALYPRYKQWCDEYFYIPCRREHRGTGGIFFDDLDPVLPNAGLRRGGGGGGGALSEFDAEAFTRAVGRGIVPSWEGIVAARRGLPFTEGHRTWQELRRGRYDPCCRYPVPVLWSSHLRPVSCRSRCSRVRREPSARACCNGNRNRNRNGNAGRRL